MEGVARQGGAGFCGGEERRRRRSMRLLRWRRMTPENVVRRIAAECTFVDERGAVGIRLNPAAAIVRQYGEQFRVRGAGGQADRQAAS